MELREPSPWLVQRIRRNGVAGSSTCPSPPSRSRAHDDIDNSSSRSGAACPTSSSFSIAGHDIALRAALEKERCGGWRLGEREKRVEVEVEAASGAGPRLPVNGAG